MTATASVSQLLDRLDAARVKATPGEWSATSERADGGAYIDADPRPPGCPPPWVGHASRAADAACIVAEHNAMPRLVAAVRAVYAKHVPWYEIHGVRHDNTVTVPCTEFADCDGNSQLDCAASDGDGHEVLACYECRCVVDYDFDGFLLWPCPTVRALASALTEEGQ